MGAVSVFGSDGAVLVMVGTWMSILAGLLLAHISEVRTQANVQAQLLVAAGVPLKLVNRPKLLESFCQISQTMAELTEQESPIQLEFTKSKLASIVDQMQTLVRGQIVFSSTESWRTVYEQVLRCKEVTCYRSVAWFKSAEYWQDEPGKKSLALNLELLSQGLRIDRVVVVRDHLWDCDSMLPAKSVCRWVEIQIREGISISLVRESELLGEPDLCSDMGIYDHCAFGIQELDDRCRTLSFTLSFEPSEVQRALERWQRLSLYARAYVHQGAT